MHVKKICGFEWSNVSDRDLDHISIVFLFHSTKLFLCAVNYKLYFMLSLYINRTWFALIELQLISKKRKENNQNRISIVWKFHIESESKDIFFLNKKWMKIYVQDATRSTTINQHIFKPTNATKIITAKIKS